MKTYTGYREHAAAGGSHGVAVLVHEPGRDPRPLDPRLDLRRHSPDGFEWGYAGSGPAQLASRARGRRPRRRRPRPRLLPRFEVQSRRTPPLRRVDPHRRAGARRRRGPRAGARP